MKWIRKPDTETRKKFGMAAAVVATLLAGLLVFYRHWQFELPFYPNVDEQLSLDCIYNLLNQHLYAGDIYILDFFRYPHFTFYYAVLGVRVLPPVSCRLAFRLHPVFDMVTFGADSIKDKALLRKILFIFVDLLLLCFQFRRYEAQLISQFFQLWSSTILRNISFWTPLFR